MPHPLTDAVADALEALGGWQPPDDEGTLITELDTFFPGVEEILYRMWGSLTRLASTLKTGTPVADTVIGVIQDAADTAAAAYADDSVHAGWRTADAGDIDRGENPRTAEGGYNYVPDAGQQGPAEHPARCITLTCQACTTQIDVHVPPGGLLPRQTMARVIARDDNDWHYRGDWLGCPDHPGNAIPPAEVQKGRVVCDEPQCDAVVTREYKIFPGEPPIDANQATQIAAAQHGWHIRSHWSGCPDHRGVSVEAAAATHPGHPLAARLATGETWRDRLSGGSVADSTYKVTLGDGSTVIEKVTQDRAPGGRFPMQPSEDQQDAEELGAYVAHTLGLQAPEIIRATPDVIYMETLPGVTAAHLFGFDPDGMQRFQGTDEGKLVGVLDVVTDNVDRHEGNWLVDSDKGRIGLIDHGSCFESVTITPDPTEAPAQSLLFSAPFVDRAPGFGAFSWAQNPIHPDDCPEIRRRLMSTLAAFETVGRADWHRFMMARWEQIQTHAAGTDRLAWNNEERSTTPCPAP